MTASPSAAAHGRAFVLRRAEELFAELPRARSGKDPEAIHDLRVASRRLTAALALFPGEKKPPRGLSDAIAEIRRAAGRVRDADVWLDWLAAAKTSARAERGAIEALLENEALRRKKGVRRCRERLANVDVAALRRALRRFAETERGALALKPAADTLREVLLDRNARAARLASAAAKSGDTEDLHEARIAYKEFRYAAESAERVFPSSKKALHRSLIRALKAIQDVLGALHDRDVFLDRAARRGERFAEQAPKSKREKLRKSFEALSSRLARERAGLLVRFQRLAPGRAESGFARSIQDGLEDGRPKSGSLPSERARSGRPGGRRIDAAAAAEDEAVSGALAARASMKRGLRRKAPGGTIS
jgi:CHAD domain-containing protein